MYHKRKDKGCEARVLAANEETVLVEARWPIGAAPNKQQRNIVNLKRDYFINRYGNVLND